jgi:hypothetical protein
MASILRCWHFICCSVSSLSPTWRILA